MGYSEKEIEINLISLIFYLIKHWRSILIVSLVTILIFTPISITKILKENDESTAEESVDVSDNTLNSEENNNTEDSSIEEYILSPLDINSVNNCYSAINNYQELKNYYSNAPYMLIDYKATPNSSAIIDISADNNSDIANITILYKNLIEDISFHEYACDYIGDNIYSWDYLVSLDVEADEKSNRRILKISIIYPDEEVCSKLLDSAIEFINSDRNSVSEVYGNFKISVISRTTEIIYSKNIEDLQNNSKNILNQTYTGIIQQIQAFNKLQIEYLNELIKSDSDDDKDISYIISDTLRIIEMQNESTIIEEAEDIITDDAGEESTEIQNNSTTPKNSTKKQLIKYIMLGFLCGSFLAIFYHMMMYIFSNRLDYTDNLTELFGIPHLGNIVRDTHYKCPLDSYIYKLQHLHKTPDENSDIDICSTDISFSIEKEKTNNPAIITCKSEFIDTDLLNRFSEKLSGLGNNTIIIQNVLCHAESFNNLANIDGAIIAGMSENTLRNDIYRLIDILKRHNIKIIGGIIIE